MNCKDAREHLDAAFDAGEPVDSAVATHAEACQACHVYAAELRALDAGLEFGAEAAPLLVSTILGELNEAASPPSFRPRAAVAGLAAAALLAVAGGYWYSLPLQETLSQGFSLPASAWNANWALDLGAVTDGAAWQAMIIESYHGVINLDDLSGAIEWPDFGLSSGMVLGAVLSAVLALCVFNGWEALHTPGGKLKWR